MSDGALTAAAEAMYHGYGDTTFAGMDADLQAAARQEVAAVIRAYLDALTPEAILEATRTGKQLQWAIRPEANP